MIKAGIRHPSGPLLLADTIRYCDSKHQHETRVITDGLRCYAHGPTTDPQEPGCRVGSTITLTCAQPLPNDEPCDAVIELDLTEPGLWAVPHSSAAQLLALYGTEVER